MTAQSASAPQKIAILGGGISALITAFELTSEPDWQSRYDITLHQLGWRLGGKCASSRGPNGRIQEHGIHAFLGSYFNTLPIMKQLYDELGRSPGEPLATFEEAFLPNSYVLMWEWRDLALRRWPLTFPTNARSPADGADFIPFEHMVIRVLEVLAEVFHAPHTLNLVESALLDRAKDLVHKAGQTLTADAAVGPAHGIMAHIAEAWHALTDLFLKLIESSEILRRLFILGDYLLTLIRGVLDDQLYIKGYDVIDDENWSDWLLRHGAHPITVSSPMALNTINLSYQYAFGDTSISPRMAAGAYVRWSLQSFAYNGAMIYMFGAGCGETVIAPLYLVLKARGVKFEFFHKVEALRLSADGQSIAAVEIGVQAQLKAPAAGYHPLIAVKGLPSWPDAPLYDQLVEGQQIQALSESLATDNAAREPISARHIDLESYWSAWQAPKQLTLKAGIDYDTVVFAISIGAIPYLCEDLLTARPAWRDMVAHIPTVQTSTLQIWLSRDLEACGWDQPMTGSNTIVSATYLNPGDGQAEFGRLVQWEDWPANHTPKSLWYFTGLLSDHHAPAPFTDHSYPARMYERVLSQSMQYLQAGIGPLLPNATTDAVNPPGDPVGLDFSLLVDTEAPLPGSTLKVGVARLSSQYMRANIDPSERYVTTPPGSTQYRLKAWGSGFSNLVLAGDWIYTGLNVGSVEGTVMSGLLAAHAVSGAPALDTIVGYPAPG